MHEALMAGYRRSRAESRAKASTGPLTAAVGAPQAQESTTAASAAGQPSRESLLSMGPLEALKFWQNPPTETPPSDVFDLTADDKRPTYAVLRSRKSSAVDGEMVKEPPRQVLGCQHYRRNVKLQCSTCCKWYTCRFCHDAAEDHVLVRKETKNMLCMVCAVAQRASDVCINCGTTAARYYCNVCKLWDDHPEKNIYHCNDCGICRRGRGLGKDFFHCKVSFWSPNGLTTVVACSDTHPRPARPASPSPLRHPTSASSARLTATAPFAASTCSRRRYPSSSWRAVIASTKSATRST